MKRKNLWVVLLLTLFVFLSLISCKGLEKKAIAPKILNPYPNQQNNIEVTEPITFSIESYGQIVEKIYLYLSNSCFFNLFYSIDKSNNHFLFQFL